ncbi:uncharacterized protein LOC132207049 [Stegostoma tigrinum]|uniref:uncharacterized protein LOC132207049 n=1 Tax=Stegostoma tigrinum TaxID=3053191 RepID=UPI002870AD67|nr:uncharacterized protein LOC132207049 [Stegostoma tigrinum]
MRNSNIDQAEMRMKEVGPSHPSANLTSLRVGSHSQRSWLKPMKGVLAAMAEESATCAGRQRNKFLPEESEITQCGAGGTQQARQHRRSRKADIWVGTLLQAMPCVCFTFEIDRFLDLNNMKRLQDNGAEVETHLKRETGLMSQMDRFLFPIVSLSLSTHEEGNENWLIYSVPWLYSLIFSLELRGCCNQLKWIAVSSGRSLLLSLRSC